MLIGIEGLKKVHINLNTSVVRTLRMPYPLELYYSLYFKADKIANSKAVFSNLFRTF